LKGKEVEQSSQTNGFQEIIVAELTVWGFIDLVSHCLIQLKWMYLADPEHLHGTISGLSLSPSSKHTRHAPFYYYG